MSYEMNFEMYVGKKEQRAEVLAVIRKALTEKGFEEFANNFVADKDDKYMIKENTCCSFSADDFDEAISTIYKAIVRELPEVVFKGFSGYTHYTYEAGHCFEKQDNTLIVGKIAYEGAGFCLECGERENCFQLLLFVCHSFYPFRFMSRNIPRINRYFTFS